MECMVGKSFPSLPQRIMYSYIGTFPGFHPVASESVPEVSQRQFYDFMKSVGQKLYDNPETIGLKTQPDDCYSDWELRKVKPELINAIRTMKKSIDDFYTLILQIGEKGIIKDGKLHLEKNDLKLSGKLLQKLGYIGLKNSDGIDGTVFWCDEHPEMLPAWKMLAASAASSKKNAALVFSHCMYDPSFPYSKGVIENLVNNPGLMNEFNRYFSQNGYKFIDTRENTVSMDWVKNYGKKDEPVKDSWAEREHGGLSIWFDHLKKHQVFFGLRVPRYKEILSHFDEMDADLKRFVIRQTKKCDNCGYCTQTDNTGTRSRQHVTVSQDGEFNLCLLFPGFTYVWTHMDTALAAEIIGFLSFTDKLLPPGI